MSKAPDMHKILFSHLVMMLSSSAMQQLGKLVNPMTNKTEIHLEGARMTIDMLEMIREKTKGNLDEEEEKLMKQTLSVLQINYVETSQSQPAPPAAEEAENKEAPAAEEKAEKKNKDK